MFQSSFPIIIKSYHNTPMFFYQFPPQTLFQPFPFYAIPDIPASQFDFMPSLTTNNIILIPPSECFQEPKHQKEQSCEKISTKGQEKKSNQASRIIEQKQRSAPQKRGKKAKEDKEFRPYVPEIKKGRATPQNIFRNVVPNIMHQVISYIQKKNKSGLCVQKLIGKLQLEEVCSVRRFYLYQVLIKDKLNSYLNADSLNVFNDLQQPTCSVYSEKQQRGYNKISWMLAYYFLKHEFESIILSSKKVKADKRVDHLKIKRKILNRLEQRLNQPQGHFLIQQHCE